MYEEFVTEAARSGVYFPQHRLYWTITEILKEDQRHATGLVSMILSILGSYKLPLVILAVKVTLEYIGYNKVLTWEFLASGLENIIDRRWN